MSLSLESLMPDAATETARSPLVDLGIFVAIGGSAALGYVALSSALIGLHTGLADWLVSAVTYALFIVPVYLMHRRFSFQSEARHSVALPRYVAVQLSALTLASLFSFICYQLMGMQSVIAGLLVIGLTSAVNFMVLKLWAFAHS